jgi:hypothetical protein
VIAARLLTRRSLDFQLYARVAVPDLVVLFLRLLVTVARLDGPCGARSVVAESVLVKHTRLGPTRQIARRRRSDSYSGRAGNDSESPVAVECRQRLGGVIKFYPEVRFAEALSECGRVAHRPSFRT